MMTPREQHETAEWLLAQLDHAASTLQEIAADRAVPMCQRVRAQVAACRAHGAWMKAAMVLDSGRSLGVLVDDLMREHEDVRIACAVAPAAGPRAPWPDRPERPAWALPPTRRNMSEEHPR